MCLKLTLLWKSAEGQGCAEVWGLTSLPRAWSQYFYVVCFVFVRKCLSRLLLCTIRLLYQILPKLCIEHFIIEIYTTFFTCDKHADNFCYIHKKIFRKPFCRIYCLKTVIMVFVDVLFVFFIIDTKSVSVLLSIMSCGWLSVLCLVYQQREKVWSVHFVLPGEGCMACALIAAA